MPDLSLYDKRRSLSDYMNANQDRQLQQFLAIKKAQSDSTGSVPAAIQIAKEIESRLAAGDIQGANLLHQTAKTFAIDRGMNAYSQPLSQMMGQPQQYDLSNPEGAIPEAELMQGINPNQKPANAAPMPSYAPNAIPGYAQAAGGIAATKKGMETQSQKDVELNMNPRIQGAEQLAKDRATAEFDIPNREGAVEKVQSLIGKIENHPGLTSVVGAGNPFLGKIPGLDAAIPGTDAADFLALQEQLKGSGFLEAIQQMKGLGALSNQEGEAATRAYAALSTSQSEKQYKESLSTLRALVDRGLQRSYQKAGTQPSFGGQMNQAAPKPDMKQARKAKDGKFYVPDPNRPGKYLQVN